MIKTLKLTGKILLIALASILALVILFLCGMNIAKSAIYPDYYAIKTDICKNPGLYDGFVCQGVCAYEEGGKFLVTGYMKDHSASRIYVTDKENNSYYVTVTLENGKPYTGHGCGIVYKGDTAYLVSEKKIHVLSLSDILGAESGGNVTVSETIPLNNSGSFVYSDGDYLYAGEFHNGNQYVTDHPYETPNDGTYYAIMCRYSFDDLTKPEKVYSITNQVQGACFTPDGKIVLSTSYGLADSYYYVYNECDAVDSGETLDGVPVYILCDPIDVVKGPAMAEGLDYYDGKVITLTESASNKYIFGKFFFADKIVGLEFED
ncbi:MAG: hypothetical protein IJX27_05485 [Clostridia bacterium]|nr:hypothetical protein [Clostridia bacterium]